MRKAILSALALACLFFAIGCSTEPDDDSKKDPDKVKDTTITATLDTASGSAIPAQFNADITWSIKDADWKVDDVYVAQAYFTGTDKTLIPIGSPFTFEKTQTGTGKYAFTIPESGLPSTVKSPYELTIGVKRCDVDFWKSDAWTFTEGKISGIYTGTLYYYTEFDPVTGEPTDGDHYDYRTRLTQYGTLVVATDIYYLYDTNEDDVNDSQSPQKCTVVMTAKTENGKTTLTGTGTYTKGDETESYSGDVSVFGDGRTLACEKYWIANDTTEKIKGNFEANLEGNASIAGTIAINENSLLKSDFKFIDEDGSIVVVLLHGFNEDNIDDNAGIRTDGVFVEKDGKYSVTYKLDGIPAGNYYIFFAGVDGGDDIANDDRLPNKGGEAVGLYGLDDPNIAIKWIDGLTLAGADKTAFDAVKPITVNVGDVLTGKDFTAIVRTTP